MQDNLLFDVASITGFSLHGLSLLMKTLKLNYAALHNALMRHNESFQKLAVDLELYGTNLPTPRQALTLLIHGLTLSKYTSHYSSTNAVSQFFDYLGVISQAIYEKIITLGRAIAFRGLENRVFKKLQSAMVNEAYREDFVEELKDTLESNTAEKFLDEVPLSSPEGLARLINKYNQSILVAQQTNDKVPFSAFPVALMRQALSFDEPFSPTELALLLINIPSQFYNLFNQFLATDIWSGGLTKYTKVFIEIIALGFKNNLLNSEQRAELRKIFLSSDQKLCFLGNLLRFAIHCRDPMFISQVMRSIPESHPLSAVLTQDSTGKTVLHQLHDEPQLLKIIFEEIPPERRLCAALLKDKSLCRDTVLDKLIPYPESLLAICSLLSEKDLLIALIDNNILLHSIDYPASLRALLSLISKDHDHILQPIMSIACGTGCLESSQLLFEWIPAEKRLAHLKSVVNKIHIEGIIFILVSSSEEDRFTFLTLRNETHSISDLIITDTRYKNDQNFLKI